MSLDVRRRRLSWQSVPPGLRREGRMYPLLGALLALGAPVGLLFLRMLTHNHFSIASIVAEIGDDWDAYLYLAISTPIVFIVIGRLLGKREEQLARYALTDPLTRVHNRRFFEARLDAECAQAIRYSSPLSVVLIDLDHLKAINDKSGHQAGDEALQLLGAGLAATVRAADCAARVGGDEFVIVAPNTTAHDAATLTERLRGRLAESGFPHSISVGVAELAAVEAKRPRDLLEAADQALYDAKNGGRDQVVVYRPSTLPMTSPSSA